MENFDIAIIGFGKCGKTLAADLAERGWKVALAERDPKMYGGACINVACIPTKALVHKAKLAEILAPQNYAEKDALYKKAIAEKRRLVADLNAANRDGLAKYPNVRIFDGEASFLSESSIGVRLENGENAEISAKHFVINTGSENAAPPIDGLRLDPPVYDSASIMELETLPRRLAIIGAGYVGLEFASIYASFGSEVSVFSRAGRLLKNEDADVSDALRKALEDKAVSFRFGASLKSLESSEGTAAVRYADERGEELVLEADAVLVAAGRKPYTKGLHPERANVALDARGAVIVDGRLRTSNPRVYAAGDVKGGGQFTYISLDDYRIIREDLVGGGDFDVSYQDMPFYSMFTDPPLARAGMSEGEAKAKGLDVRVNRVPASAVMASTLQGNSKGMLKAVIDNKTDAILGCTLFCVQANELINTLSLAIRTGQKAQTLRDFIYTHPSMSEIFNALFK